MDIRVRKANRHDINTLLDLKKETSAVLLIRLGHTLDQIAAWQARYCTVSYMEKQVRAPNAMYLVHRGDEIAGMAALTVRNDGDDAYGYFSNLYCRESAEGLGSRLMVHRLAVMDHFNLDYISSHVHSENERAQRFVLHYGFEEYGRYKEPTLGSTNIQFRLYPKGLQS